MEQKTLTLSQALSEGYTQFMMGKPGKAAEEEFVTYPLDEALLKNAFRRINDADFDLQESLDDEETFQGKIPMLCSKPKSPSITAKDLSELLCDRADLDDELVPSSIIAMAEVLHEDETFLEGLALINKAMAEYKSYTDTDILVTLDTEASDSDCA